MNDATRPRAPSAVYAAGIARGEWQDDPAQRALLPELDRLYTALATPRSARGWWPFARPPEAVPGLYLWGAVGRGKTLLADLLAEALAGPGVTRTHFHRFMREINAGLRTHSGQQDPLALIARDWHAQALRLLVLDEFIVNDIGDAMLLGRLLTQLFEQGVTLVATSNTAPADLYRDGLQRERFLPAIAAIEAHCHVHELASATDYRLRALTRAEVYRAPLAADDDAWLAARFGQLAGNAPREASITLDGRRIPVRGRGHGVAWFDFDALCTGPRAASDYIQIAHEFGTVLVGGIPLLATRGDDIARRLVTLVDECYDRRVKLVCTAAAPPMQLYPDDGRLAAEFARTASRLTEMQSTDYLARPHLE
jgi:cell division protein ZapE